MKDLRLCDLARHKWDHEAIGNLVEVFGVLDSNQRVRRLPLTGNLHLRSEPGISHQLRNPDLWIMDWRLSGLHIYNIEQWRPAITRAVNAFLAGYGFSVSSRTFRWHDTSCSRHPEVRRELLVHKEGQE